ncbi:olfactory receptor 5V1-like [Aquarana catesbeiana]|uniref:olfactory receptor 5V1-like n=1 Tax=Aquarana catesbeiana TaxID=8400 RepID=UPI003CCA3CF4
MNNGSSISEFILIGLSNPPEFRILLFLVILVMYLITIGGNVLILFITKFDSALNTPMYFFLGNLSFLDVICTTSAVPKMLFNLISQKKTISFNGCIIQMFVFTVGMDTEFLLLTLMSLDRYLAICNPLRYKSIMDKKACIFTSLIVWTFGFSSSTFHSLSTLWLSFCGPKEINHFFCEVPQVLALSCTDITLNKQVLIATDLVLGLICIVIIFISYMFIIAAILNIRSMEGKKKAFSTCASHLAVVLLFYGTLIFAYFKPSDESSNMDKEIAVFYTIVIPLLNPILYSLRNKEVKASVEKIILRKILLSTKSKSALSN